MESDISKLHKGTDGFYYEDYIAPDKPETFVGKLVSTEWWHKGVRFAPDMQLSGRRRAEDCLIAFQKHTGFYGPRDGAVNFKHVEKNTLWECEIRKTRTERCTWMSARQIVELKTDAI